MSGVCIVCSVTADERAIRPRLHDDEFFFERGTVGLEPPRPRFLRLALPNRDDEIAQIRPRVIEIELRRLGRMIRDASDRSPARFRPVSVARFSARRYSSGPTRNRRRWPSGNVLSSG